LVCHKTSVTEEYGYKIPFGPHLLPCRADVAIVNQVVKLSVCRHKKRRGTWVHGYERQAYFEKLITSTLPLDGGIWPINLKGTLDLSGGQLR